MSLARGEALVPEGAAGPSTTDGTAVVIAIAPSAEERLRVARIVGDHAPLLLVSSREEAVAVLGAALEHHESPTAVPGATTAGTQVDSELRVLRHKEAHVPLTPLEHDLLLCLLDPPLRTWASAELHRAVWGNDHLGGGDDLQSVVKRLRRKLRLVSSPLGIVAVRGVGLRLVDASP